MPPKKNYRDRRNTGLDESAQRVLTTGSDSFREFAGDAGRLLLAELWATHGSRLLDEYVLKNPDLRPMAWWWWGAPTAIRVEYPHRILKTEQRQSLLKHHLLDAAAVVLAEKKISDWKRSKQPMLLWDLSH